MDKATLRLLEAISFAARRHEGTARKDEVTPYVAHPVRVLVILRSLFGVEDPEILAASVLHDVIEDTATDRDALSERFGDTVAGYVAALTKDKRLREDAREEQYLAQLSDAPVAVKLCKLADTLDNLLDADALGPAGKRKVLAKAKQLIARFEPALPEQHRTALELVRRCVQEKDTNV